MRENSCAIFETDESYAHKLANVMSAKANILLKPIIFTKEEALKEYLEKRELKILIVNEMLLTEEIQHMKIHKIIVLKEEDIYEKDCPSHVCNIYKYQSSENLIREILNHCTKLNNDLKTKTDIIGIYSPVGNCFKTSFSLAVSGVYAKQKQVLYINLEEFSGLGEVLPESHYGNLSDAAYYYNISKEEFFDFIECAAMTLEQFKYIPPIKCAEDIHFVSGGQWKAMIGSIADSRCWDVIVLDISNAVKEPWKLIEICTRCFMPVREDYISEKKISDFETYLLHSGQTELYEKIEKIQIPYDKTINLNTNFVENLEWSRLGQFVQDIVYAENDRTN